MKIILKNITSKSLVSIIDKKTRAIHRLEPGEECILNVDSEADVKEYRDSYEAFGINISIKEPEIDDPVIEPTVTTSKPRRSRKSTKGVEEVSVETVSSKPVVEEPKEDSVEEPKEDSVEEPKE